MNERLGQGYHVHQDEPTVWNTKALGENMQPTNAQEYRKWQWQPDLARIGSLQMPCAVPITLSKNRLRAFYTMDLDHVT